MEWNDYLYHNAESLKRLSLIIHFLGFTCYLPTSGSIGPVFVITEGLVLVCSADQFIFGILYPRLSENSKVLFLLEN